MKALFRCLCLTLSLLMPLSLCACGASAPAPTPEPTVAPTPAPTPEPTPEPTPAPTVQSVDILYAGTKLDDFTMKVGQTVPLQVSVLPADLPLEVSWYSEAEGEGCFEFQTSESDPSRCDLLCVAPLPAGSGGVYLYAQVYGGRASCKVHVIGTELAAMNRKTGKIYYPLEDKTLSDFTMRVGEAIILEAVALNEEYEGPITWGMDEKAATALRFVEDKSKPGRVTLECFGALPAGTGGVSIYAEIDGVKNGCIVYVK